VLKIVAQILRIEAAQLKQIVEKAAEYAQHHPVQTIAMAALVVVPGADEAIIGSELFAAGDELAVGARIATGADEFSVAGSPIAAEEAGGTDVLYHGTDLASARSIVAGGLDRSAASELGGGDEFWTTRELDTARWFARANPAGSAETGVVGMRLPGSVETAEKAGLISRHPTGAYIVNDWSRFNDAVRFFLTR
jgi:hypothetical protein